ncbi:hypothetical protein Tph_c10630 [Thermacetogenium phaeum DSM 12270]|uniref:Tetratricopeptide repeat protein n=1 Tax=Thermacetogenium phaeum (strain ATCC BAA-254 / DSM 26808 / PB) TaxID=1089553 RepID=K4LH74_THEPS|nr:hypothetical protein [Thermacetogenium phaeum]AFV11285.1 hypothetical protein Tph_c10630 [Thermacetogenium phaeum DSM 12270]
MKECTDVKKEAKGAIIRLARHLEATGHACEARDLYLKLMNEYPESEEAFEARKSLLSQAREYERRGMVHNALDIYRILLLG